MKTQSIWKDVKTKECTKIDRDIDTDVLIIGGGITGIEILYQLKTRGQNAILVERNICGEGVTSKSTAKITYLQNDTIPAIASFLGEQKAEIYALSQMYATKILANIIETEHIDCDLEKVDSYLFTETKNGPNKLKVLKNLLQNCDILVEEKDSMPFKKTILKAIETHDTYVFHPLKFINALKDKFKDSIYEYSKVEKIEKVDGYYISHIGNYQVKSKYVVLATHYPYFLFPYLMPLKTHIEVAYLGAKKIPKKESFSAINIDKPTISMRYHSSGKQDYLIYLLNSFISSNVGDINENFADLKKEHKFDYIWSNNDIITGDYMPLIGPIKKNDDTLLIATGYNTWGMTNATLAGIIIRDIITEKRNDFTELFSPTRMLNLSKILRFPLDIGCNAKSFLISTRNNKNNANVVYTKRDGQNVAIYKDSKGVEHVVLNRCPHMKCGIVLNEVEKTWDCLCHGSRYTLDGKCIEGPSNQDITFKPKDKKDS